MEAESISEKQGRAMVVGAGVSGMRAALDLAETGYHVTLIEEKTHIGGVVSQLDHQFPTDGCGICKMLPHADAQHLVQQCVRKGLSHENITIYLQTRVMSVSGEPGNFTVTLQQHPNPVDPERCIGCGLCIPVCPVDVADLFNAGKGFCKAIGPPTPHMAAGPYRIDTEACTQCGKCRDICPTEAIGFPAEDRKSFTILVVDDEKIIRDSLSEWLGEEGGFSVITAESGEKALERIEEQPVDLMLADIKMPGMDGITLLEKALEIRSQMPVMMITAYATVDTAVSAMKQGAADYLVKPFDPDDLLPKIVAMYHELTLPPGPEIRVGAIVLAGGTDEYDPASGKNPFGYKIIEDVVTGPEFERMLSPVGPTKGRLERLSDQRPLRRIAWILCVGSRDIQAEADYCSGVCCMYCLKQARLAQKAARLQGAEIETVLYYMDMRTFGKSGQPYRDAAEAEGSVCRRSRVHSIVGEETSGDLCIRAADPSGQIREDRYDLAVLATGQRPSAKVTELAEMLGIALNPWGFIHTREFSLTQTSGNGVLAAGSCTGRKDISDAVICGSSAAFHASRLLHAGGGSLREQSALPETAAGIFHEPPRVFTAVCGCSGAVSEIFDPETFSGKCCGDPALCSVETADWLCTEEGLAELAEKIRQSRANRVVIGACRPLCAPEKKKTLARAVSLLPELVEIVDLRSQIPAAFEKSQEQQKADARATMNIRLEMALTRVKFADPSFAPDISTGQSVLVIGGGIAGMTAALGVADHGYRAYLVEKSERLGGNLNWLHQTIEGDDIARFAGQSLSRVENHPLIQVYTNTQVTEARGTGGAFTTILQTGGEDAFSVEHGAVILATGGRQAETEAFGRGTDSRIITQQELESRIREKELDPGQINSMCMILCAGTRQAPKNYCSRVCCASALKHALHVKEKNPEAGVYVLYRDMMAYGFLEAWFTRARKAGVIFIAYTPDTSPEVSARQDAVRITATEPILRREVEISADLLVLATGIEPAECGALARSFGADTDEHGFFREAEPKWQPMGSLAPGVYACGIGLRPAGLAESAASAEAAALQAVIRLGRNHLPAPRNIAHVRHSLCSLCQNCIAACEYGARTYDPQAQMIIVDPEACRGCGACASACPNFAAYVEGFAPDRMLSMLAAAIDN